MTIEAQSGPAASREPQGTVSGASALYDHVQGSQFNLSLTLSAKMTAEGNNRKIVASQLYLESDDKRAVRVFNGTAPQSELFLDQTFYFAVDDKGPVAVDAIAACNSQIVEPLLPDHAITISIGVPVVWSVTTGKFDFPWTNYDLVAPSEEFVKNPDFYTDRKTFERQTTARLMISCQPPPPQQPMTGADAEALQLGDRLITHVRELENGGGRGNGR
jgi:hypothetical protein